MAQTSGTISVAVLGGTSGVVALNILGYGGTGRANTIFIWGAFDGATIGFQSRPDMKNTDGTYEWFNVLRSDGTVITWTAAGTSKTQPHGAFSFIGRAGAYQLTYSGLTGNTDIKFEVR